MKHISLLVTVLIVLLTSCSKDDSGIGTNSNSKNNLKEITTTHKENGDTVNFSKVVFSYNDKNQITSLSFSNQSISFILNYRYNTKNQIINVETIDNNNNNKTYYFDFSYNDDSMIPSKIIRISEPTTETEILNIDNSIFWKNAQNELCNISNLNVKDYTFSEYTYKNKTTTYKFHKRFKNGLEHTNSNFSLVNLIFISYMTSDIEFFTIYGLEYLDAPFDELLLSNGTVLKFEYQMQNNIIASRSMRNTQDPNSIRVLQTYTYY